MRDAGGPYSRTSLRWHSAYRGGRALLLRDTFGGRRRACGDDALLFLVVARGQERRTSQGATPSPGARTGQVQFGTTAMAFVVPLNRSGQTNHFLWFVCGRFGELLNKMNYH
jgi:hypothetical protein